MRIKRWSLGIGLAGGCLLAMWAQDLALQQRENEIHVSAPRLHFLTGTSLQSLKNGAAVPFDFQLTLWVGTRASVFDRTLQRFVVSYDLWEEKFSIVKQRGFSVRGGSRSLETRRSVSNLTAAAAEAWCIDSVALPTVGIRPDQPLWVKLDVRRADPREGNSDSNDSGLTLTALIELFSRPIRPSEQRWTLETGPVRFSDVKPSTGRGS